MHGIDAALDWGQLALWVLLALAGYRLWRATRNASASWLALTFASLAVVVVAGRFLGTDPTPNGARVWLIKLLIADLLLFPYLLYRFLDSIDGRRRFVWVAAHVLTAAVITTSALMPRFPEPGEPRPVWFTAWMFLFMAQWVFLLSHVAIRLWRSGQHQAAVARKRMRMLGSAAFLLSALIALSAFQPASTEPTVESLIIKVIGMLAGPLFLFGFAPPRLLRAHWRRKDEAALREMEIGLVKALSRTEIADALLPAVVDLLGGEGAALVDTEGEVLGRRGLDDAAAIRLVSEVPDDHEHYVPFETEHAQIIAMETGWLVVRSGPYTPFFGADELQMLSASSVLADLALGRAKLFELETQAREAMRDFVAIASHDLRTPVTVIQGFSQLLSQEWDNFSDADRRGYASAISRQVIHLDRLIRDLLTVSRLDVDEIDVCPMRVNLLDTARDTVIALTDGEDITVSGASQATAIADPEHVLRILQNYIKNAMVYGKPPYAVEVSEDSSGVTVKVIDHGAGVPESFIPHLFEKFARLDKKKSKSVQGTGLGLSIVRGLARANGGEAWYEPDEEGGSCFAFRLPPAPRVIDMPVSDDMTDTGLNQVGLRGTA